MNGIIGNATDDDDSQDEAALPANGSANGLSARSTSSALNERTSRSPAPPITVPARNVPGKHHQHQHQHHHRDATSTSSSRNVSGASTATTGGPGSSPHAGSGTAKETFLNYFFGQNGPGPLSGPNAERTGLGAPTGRDVSGADPALESGLMAGKRGAMDRSNAAYDMKSLGRHIEAVS